MSSDTIPQVTIDPNIGLPLLESHPDEPSGICYSIGKSIRGLWASRETEDAATNRDLYVRTTLRELFVYLLFLITTLVSTFYLVNEEFSFSFLFLVTFGSTSSSRYYLTDALENVFIATDPKSFDMLVTYADVFTYLKGPFLDGLFWDSWYNDKTVVSYGEDPSFVFYANKVLGLARIRQLRVQNGSCVIPEQFRGIIFSCFGDYSEEFEDTNAFEPNSSSAWQYQNASSTNAGSYWGKIATYGGGGYIQDLAKNKNDSLAILEGLQANRWIDQATRAVFVDLTLFNPNLNLFATIRLLVEFPSTGGVLPSSDVRVARFIQYLNNTDYAVLVFEILFVIFVLYYIGEEIIEMSKLKSRYFLSAWNILDMTVLVAAISCIAFSAYRDVMISGTLPSMIARSDQFTDYQHLSFYQINLNNARAITVFIAWIKIFKYLSFNKTMMQLSNTLGKAAKDLTSFTLIFFVVFFAFAQLGFFLFGTQLKTFSDIGTSSFTLLRTLLCDFDFEAYQSANRVLGPIFFFLYVFFIYFILLNMFLAIINDTYSMVKTDLQTKRADFEIADYVKKVIDRIVKTLHIRKMKSGKSSGNTMTQQIILKQRAEKELAAWQNDLKNRGYTEEEIVTLFGGSGQATDQPVGGVSGLKIGASATTIHRGKSEIMY